MNARPLAVIVATLVLSTFVACDSPGSGGNAGDAFVGQDTAAPPDAPDMPDGIDTIDTGGPSDTGSPTDTDTSDTTPPQDTTVDTETTGPNAPHIIRLSTSIQRMTWGEAVVFSAVVTDPDGIDDLIGGILNDPTSGSTYGAFATSAAEGAYELRLGWEEIHQTSPIGFAETLDRVFVAEFFDQAGNSVGGEISVELHCSGRAACDGVCGRIACDGRCDDDTFADDRDNCGACGYVCPEGAGCGGGECYCPDGGEVCAGKCAILTEDAQNCGACGHACGNEAFCYRGYCECGANGECGAGETCGDYVSSGEEEQTCFVVGEARLSGGTADSGLLEVEMSGEWYPVCVYSSSDLAAVACRELGLGEVGSITTVTIDDDAYLSSSFVCTGSEASLAECAVGLRSSCPFGDFVQLTCSSSTCTPDCDGRNCGDDGCGGSCGECPEGVSCSESGQCGFGGWTCNPDFYGTDDGCDCGCGARDPDCPGTGSDVCEYCDGSGSCATSCSDIDPNDNAQCR